MRLRCHNKGGYKSKNANFLLLQRQSVHEELHIEFGCHTKREICDKLSIVELWK
jgi:hypothetical protein